MRALSYDEIMERYPEIFEPVERMVSFRMALVAYGTAIAQGSTPEEKMQMKDIQFDGSEIDTSANLISREEVPF